MEEIFPNEKFSHSYIYTKFYVGLEEFELLNVNI